MQMRWLEGVLGLPERLQLPPRLAAETVAEDSALTANEGGMP